MFDQIGSNEREKLQTPSTTIKYDQKPTKNTISLVAMRGFAQYILRYVVREEARQSRGSGIGYLRNWPIKGC
jgi:hypothetical protein